MGNITFRVSDNSKEDFLKKMELEEKLHSYLKTRSSHRDPEEWEIVYENLYGSFGFLDNKTTFVVFAENDNKTIGYIEVETDYSIRTSSHGEISAYGAIKNIYIEPKFRVAGIALQLLRKGVNILLEHGVDKAIVNVHTDNPFRFFHYAICDEVLSTKRQIQKDGPTRYTKTLAINDLRKIQNMSLIEIFRKKREHQKNYEVHGMEMGEVAVGSDGETVG